MASLVVAMNTAWHAHTTQEHVADKPSPIDAVLSVFFYRWFLIQVMRPLFRFGCHGLACVAMNTALHAHTTQEHVADKPSPIDAVLSVFFYRWFLIQVMRPLFRFGCHGLACVAMNTALHAHTTQEHVADKPSPIDAVLSLFFLSMVSDSSQPTAFSAWVPWPRLLWPRILRGHEYCDGMLILPKSMRPIRLPCQRGRSPQITLSSRGDWQQDLGTDFLRPLGCGNYRRCESNLGLSI